MSFQNKGFSMLKDIGCLTDGDITYGNTSRIEPKRQHQWFIDGGEPELFPNKKQAIECNSSDSFAEMQASTVSMGSVSRFHSLPSQLDEHLFNSESTRSIAFHDMNIPSASSANLNMRRRLMEQHLGNNSSFELSIGHSMNDPMLGINYGGVRKVKVSEVRDSENTMPISTGHSYSREDNSIISTAHGYDKSDDSGVSMGLTYGGQASAIGIGESYIKEEDNFMSVGQPFNKGDANMILIGHNYKAPRNTLTMETSFGQNNANIMSMTENFNKRDDVIPMGIFSKGYDITSLSQTYKDVHCSIPLSTNYGKRDASMMTIAQSTCKGESHSLSMGHSFDKGGGNIISFGGFGDDDVNASRNLLCSSYDLLMNQSSDSRSDTLNHKNLVASDAYALINTDVVSVSGAQGSSKKKEDQKSSKKISPNNFPSNVRSLLSTGILDEVPVKYAAWSREKELRGIIKGSGYLCGCQSCNFSKVINAYELERHAGCKTKHPNNHIYFENGKTIYGIVQELRSTSPSMLFDVIQTITGSPINQKHFRLWKESFLAATRELQRIYGKDDRNQPL